MKKYEKCVFMFRFHQFDQSGTPGKNVHHALGILEAQYRSNF